jgi:hypothetical protein
MSTENERLGREVAALRALLAAVRDLANVPYPAGYDDMQRYYNTCANRIDSIAIYANPDRTVGEGPRTADMLHNAAEDLRRETARPLRYAPKAPEPEPEANVPAACESHGGTAEPAACWECQAELRRAGAILAEDAARYHGFVRALDGTLRFCASAPGHKFGCRDSDGHVIITAVEPDTTTDAVEGEGSDLD